jgi:hypothetical protein
MVDFAPAKASRLCRRGRTDLTMVLNCLLLVESFLINTRLQPGADPAEQEKPLKCFLESKLLCAPALMA